MLIATPAAVMVPVRATWVFGDTVKATFAGPEPADDATAIQPALLVAVHAQPAGPAIVIVPVPPDAANSLVETETDSVHAAALCRTVARCPLMLMAPSRPTPLGFGVARNCTCPPPWPCAGVRSVIHPASAEAVHSHSGVVFTETVPAPPPASSGSAGAVSVTLHFGPPGPTTDSEDVDPQAEASRARTTPENFDCQIADNRKRTAHTIGACETQQASRHRLIFGRSFDRRIAQLELCREARHTCKQDSTRTWILTARFPGKMGFCAAGFPAGVGSTLWFSLRVRRRPWARSLSGYGRARRMRPGPLTQR